MSAGPNSVSTTGASPRKRGLPEPKASPPSKATLYISGHDDDERRAVMNDLYRRLLCIPCSKSPDWEAAQAELDAQRDYELAQGSLDHELTDADAVTRLRHAIEHPFETGFQRFVHRDEAFYLVVGYEWDPPEALEAMWGVDDSDIAEAAGFEVVATGEPVEPYPTEAT